jgi:hypothetical protein
VPTGIPAAAFGRRDIQSFNSFFIAHSSAMGPAVQGINGLDQSNDVTCVAELDDLLVAGDRFSGGVGPHQRDRIWLDAADVANRHTAFSGAAQAPMLRYTQPLNEVAGEVGSTAMRSRTRFTRRLARTSFVLVLVGALVLPYAAPAYG